MRRNENAPRIQDSVTLRSSQNAQTPLLKQIVVLIAPATYTSTVQHGEAGGWHSTDSHLASSAVNRAAKVPHASGVSLKEAHVQRAASSLEPLTHQASGKPNVAVILTRVQIPGLLLGS